MAEEQSAVAVAQMHAVTLTITEIAALGALVFLHPFAVAIFLVTVLPHVHEVVLVDVPLIIVCTDAGTGGNGAVSHHGADADTCLTGEKPVAHLALIVAEKTLTAIVCTDATFLTYLFNIVKDTTELFVRKPHHRVKGCSTNREDGKESPALYALGD